MGTIAEKLTYLDGTKQALKEGINNLGGSITSETTFREYAQELDTIYSNLPKVSNEGTEVTLNPTLKGKLGIVEKGNSIQEGTPTPESPISIKNVTGNNNVVVTNSDNTESQTLSLNLGTIELNKIGTYDDNIFKAVNGNPFYDSLTAEQKALLTYGKWYKHNAVRKLELAIADMNNNDNYPGWKNQSQVVDDFSITSGSYPISFYSTFAMSNIYSSITSAMCACNSSGALYLQRAVYGEDWTQLYWKTNYPNLVFQLYYGIPTDKQDDTELTDTTLINQLENIDKMQGYNGTTIITSTYEEGNAQMIISVSALKGE